MPRLWKNSQIHRNSLRPHGIAAFKVDKHLSEKLLMEVEDNQDVDPLDDSLKDKS